MSLAAACLLLTTSAATVSAAPASECRARDAAGSEPVSPDVADTLVAACEATVAGDYERAVGLLQGILTTVGNAPFVMQHLSELYDEMGSPETARYYRMRAKELAARDPAIAAELDERTRIRSGRMADEWDAAVQLGVRYQSNPALAPELTEIDVGGLRFALPAELSDAADWNLEAAGWLRHRKWLGAQYAWVTDASFYGAAYSQQNSLDFSLAELTTGPEYASARRSFRRYRLRPHLVGVLSYFDDAVYEQTLGLGLDLSCRIGPRTEATGTYQYRERDFADTGNGSTSADRSGGENRVEVDFLQSFPRGRFAGFGLFARWVDAEREIYEYDRFGTKFHVSFGARNALFRGKPRTTHTVYAFLQRTRYGDTVLTASGAPDQTDNEFRIGVLNRIPLSDHWAVQLSVELMERQSNTPLYDATNELAALNFEWRF
jgi:hypothetical protein